MANAERLPQWWRDASPRLASAPLVTDQIKRGVELFDAEAAAARLVNSGFAIIDGLLGAVAATAVRESIRVLDADGALRLGKLQHGTQQNIDNQTRSDRIAFIPSAQASGLAKGTIPIPEHGVLKAYVGAFDRMRARLSAHVPLVERVGGPLDDCNFMCAVYPGGGARYVKHRDALPYRAGRKLTVRSGTRVAGHLWLTACAARS
jgi:hypothetical protein